MARRAVQRTTAGHGESTRSRVADPGHSLVLLAILLGTHALQSDALAQSPPSAQPDQPPANGRVVATVTTLDGTVSISGVQVELRTVPDATVLAMTTTDGVGRVAFPDIPPGSYVIRADRPGFVAKDSPPFDVSPGDVTQVLLDIQLTFLPTEIEVRADTSSPTESVQPVSTSDMLTGAVFEIAPLEGDDFQSLLLILPSTVRGPDGRLRIKGGQPAQGALQVSSVSLNDPSSGDFDLDLPAQSIESVEVLANPFAAEYGRFSTSITQIRTRRGTNEWDVQFGSLVPRFRTGFTGIRAFEPRFSVRGPLERDRVFVAQDFQFRHVDSPVKSLAGEPNITLRSFDSFTRIDAAISARHMLTAGLLSFPREIRRVMMNTFRPPDVAQDFSQSGWSVGLADRLALGPHAVLDTTVAGRWFEVHADTDGRSPMVFAPPSQSGSFFNDQEREVASFQWVQTLSLSRDWRGMHVLKVGTDLQHSAFDGTSRSRPVEIRRNDGSLAERIEFGGPTEQAVSGVEFAAFAQDRWRLNSRVTLEFGARVDRDAIVKRLNWSPRGGIAVSVAPEGRAILRGGYGRFFQRTPLNVEAFPTFESRALTRFDPDGRPMGPPVSLVNVLDANLRTPEARVVNVEWNQRLGRRVLIKLEFLRRTGSHEYIVDPDPAAGRLRLASLGSSRYREFEATTRYVGGERRDVTVSYVWAKGTADLNSYDQFFGNLRNPIVRPNGYGMIPTDVRHRLLVRGTLGLPGQWIVAPILELRSGFPWSAVDEFHDFVGDRNGAGRLPPVRTLDFSLTRPWQFGRHRFRAGVRVYNVFGASANRDVQNNVTSPDFGRFFNPLGRSIGFTFGSGS
jgi:hypothetical protein